MVIFPRSAGGGRGFGVGGFGLEIFLASDGGPGSGVGGFGLEIFSAGGGGPIISHIFH